ncbi:MAG: hypothetical protein COA54_11065 [Thiotrichaceae bacterium]|nr:MAG: hypothetical protein COA54_11065 [Thiotrichaceae bacterium]
MFRLIYFYAIFLLVITVEVHAVNENTASIGVLAFRGEPVALERWRATADYLSEHVAGYKFEIQTFDLVSMEEAVATGELNFILTNPGQYATFETKYGVSRMVTMQTTGGENYPQFGSAVIARADRKDLQELSDLKGKHLMAVSPNAFGGYQMVWHELKQLGISPKTDISGLTFSGFPQDNIVISVINGEADAGIVRTGIIERMIKDGTILSGQIKVLSSRQSEDFSLKHSTRLYPEWPFAKLKHTSSVLAKMVAENLLAVSATDISAQKGRIIGWTIPLDYTLVHELLRDLRIGPYANLGKVTIQYIMREYSLVIFSFLMTLLILIISVVITKNANQRLVYTQAKLKDHRRKLKDEVTSQTEKLHQVNKCLRKDIQQREKAENTVRRSREAIRSLYEIAVDYDRDHDEKLNDLIALGRRHYGMEAGLLYEVVQDGFSLCFIDGDDRYTNDVAHCLKGLSAIDQTVEITPDHSHCNGRGLLAFPVVVHGNVCCVLAFVGDANNVHTGFDKVDKDLLLLMASWIGSEMEYKDARMEKELHKSRLIRVARLNTMGQMASELAHELNQPLTAAQNYIGGGIRIMSHGEGSTDEVLIGMEKALESVNRATAVIRHLRQIVRTGVPSKDWFKLSDAIEHIMEMLESNAEQLKVKIDYVIHDADAELWGDAMQIEQVLLNLVRNALEATPPESRVSIVTECTEELITIRIDDQGRGIDTEEGESVFDPFYTTKVEGMGLGLSICRAIIEAHDGKIWAENTTRGASFIFELPTSNKEGA